MIVQTVGGGILLLILHSLTLFYLFSLTCITFITKMNTEITQMVLTYGQGWKLLIQMNPVRVREVM